MNVDNRLFFALAEEQLAAGHQVKMVLKGSSMLPTLHEGDTLLLEPLAGEPRVGDVILFRHPGTHLVHRLVAAAGDSYVMQGDNNVGVETIRRSDMLARLVSVDRADGGQVRTDSPEWQRIGKHALRRRRAKTLLVRRGGRVGRRQLRPWYFGLLAFLMWAPLNGLGVPLDNYVFGLRLDHLLHASVYLPCALFLMDFGRRRNGGVNGWTVWLLAMAVGLTTECVQYLLPWRGFDINDLVANSFGSTLGWLAVVWVRGRLTRR